MTSTLAKLHRMTTSMGSEKGATAVEYGLMVALIAVVIIVAVVALGENLSTVFSNVANKI